ncbi:unnamed protein product [Cyprideis torosa]|uniref:Uncharacterized protein n=1 Tax=Cyprideis torosa TaxID=163714 RepID=A0A7R8WLA8_9CRUS|nr:unnamed protein product [Cyprideis torosa]CAG0901369.1 unnamed protein product [Cyprideis torosa]
MFLLSCCMRVLWLLTGILGLIGATKDFYPPKYLFEKQYYNLKPKGAYYRREGFKQHRFADIMQAVTDGSYKYEQPYFKPVHLYHYNVLKD